MIDRRNFVAGLGAAACAHPLRAQASERGLDLALENGMFWAGSADGATTDAVGIAAGRIVALGRERVRALTRLSSLRVDVKGAFGMPAFADAHTHFLSGSLTLTHPDLLSATDRASFAERIGAAARAAQRSLVQAT